MSLVNWEDSAEESLAELLSFKLPQSKSGAIVSRRFASFYPAGSNVYGPAAGTRSMRFVLAGDQGFVLPDTMQLRCVAKAASGTKLASDGGLSAAFTRLRIYVGGALLEDIAHYSRCVQMLRMCGPKDAALDWGIMAGEENDAFPTSGQLVLSMPLISGLRFCQKALPLKSMGSLVVELEITPTSTEFADHAWTLEGPVLQCDILEAPEAQEAIQKRILSGSSVPITMSSFFSTMSSITADSTINISRSLSKLKRVFVSFIAATGDSHVDDFKHPTGDFSFQLRIGSRLIPETAIEDDATAYYQLHKALGGHKDAVRSINIDKAGYGSHKYLLCLSTEKLEGEPWSGISLKNGDLTTLQFRNAGGVGFSFAVLEHELVLSLGEVNEILA